MPRVRRGWILFGAAAATSLAVCWPLLARGFVLTYDMVFVPHLSFDRDLLGLGAIAPRAVPADLLIAAGSLAVPAEILQKVILAGSLLLAAWGVARLVPTERTAAAVAGGVFFTWTAFVYERLLMGHWPLLVAMGAMPWAVRAAFDLHARADGALRRVAGWLALASFSGAYGGVVVGGTVLAVMAGGAIADRRSGGLGRSGRLGRLGRVGLVAGLVVALNLPWLVPALLHPGGLPVRDAGVSAFRSQSDSPLGTIGSLVTLGGIWNGAAAPPGRSGWAWVPAFAVLLGIAAFGWPLLLRRWPRGPAVGLLVAAGAGLVLAASQSIPGLRGAMTWAILHLPGGGLLRDPQKFVMPLALVEAVGFGAGAERVLDALWTRRLRAVAATVLIVAPVALLPSLAWAEHGRLGTSAYPADWQAARDAMASDPVPGAVLVLPWHLYVAFPWNAERIVLQPSQRYFPRRAIVRDDLELVGTTIPGEDPWAAKAAPAVHGSRPLAPALPGLGIRYVALEKIGDWRRYLPRLRGLEVAARGPNVILYRAPPPRVVAFAGAPAVPVIAGDLLAAALVLWTAVSTVLARRRRGLLSFDDSSGEPSGDPSDGTDRWRSNPRARARGP